MVNRSKANYWIDIIIEIAFLLSIMSGLVLLFAPSGGYKGGRNPTYGGTVLQLGHHLWVELHNWSSILMAVGVLGHLVLHWNWLTCMTKKLFRRARKQKTTIAACPNPTV